MSVNKMIWVAQYNDGTSLRQFNPDNSENLFKDINQDKLVEFCILNEEEVYSINLSTGIFNLNGLKISFDEVNSNDAFRLIYFKRVRQSIGGINSVSITYNIGYQTTKNNKNVTRYLMISEEGIKFNCGGK